MNTCRQCNEEKPEEEYYYNAVQKRRFPVCKNCIKTTRTAKYVRQPTGFNRLPKETQQKIRDALKEYQPLTQIAKDNRVSYVSLWGWMRKGLIVA